MFFPNIADRNSSMVRYFISILLFFCYLSVAQAQSGGDGVYTFLKTTHATKSVALGGIQVALSGSEPDLLLSNPAMLTSEMDQSMGVNYVRYLAGIGFGQAVYAKDFGNLGTAALGIQFANYGQFVAADENGVITGTFTAADYALLMTYRTQVGDSWSFGTTLKPIYSHLENYKSFGMAADLGLLHYSADRLTVFAICLRDLGAQLKPYYEGSLRESVTSSLQAGVSHRLLHAPVSYAVTAFDLNHWDQPTGTTDPNQLPSSDPKKSLFTLLLRHLSWGVEIFPSRQLTVRIGYNYRKAVDMALSDHSTFSGFSTGLGLHLPSFNLNYALSGYAHAGLVHQFSISTNFGMFSRK